MHSADPEMALLTMKLKNQLDQEPFRDHRHPTKPGRTYLGDLSKLIDKFENQADKVEHEGEKYPIMDMRRI